MTDLIRQVAFHKDFKLQAEFENIYRWYNKNPLSNVISVTATGTLTVLHAGLCEGDTSSGAITSTLPAAAGNTGLTYTYKLIDNTNSWTIARAGTDLIDGATSLVLRQLYRSVTLRSDGSGWVVVSGVDSTPTGIINAFGGALAQLPTGYLACDGSSVLRADYPALFAAIGTAWGTADGTHFNLPDGRGKFLRGVDHAVGNDPDRATRTAQAAGGATGDAVGSIQADAFKSHTHVQNSHVHMTNLRLQGGAVTAGRLVTGTDASAVVDYADTDATTATNQNTGGNETRPINAYVEWIIRY